MDLPIRSLFSASRFDSGNWVVTLLRVREHAEIAVEGVRIGKVFREYAHFRGPKFTTQDSVWLMFKGEGRVCAFKPITKKFKHHPNVRSWVRPAADVQKMVDNINLEAKNIKKRPFSILGRHSIFNSRKFILSVRKLCNRFGQTEFYNRITRHFRGRCSGKPNSCITWAQEKLKICGIQVEKPKYCRLITRTSYITG